MVWNIEDNLGRALILERYQFDPIAQSWLDAYRIAPCRRRQFSGHQPLLAYLAADERYVRKLTSEQ